MEIFRQIGIAGLGFVGDAIDFSFGRHGLNRVVYDKYREGGIGSPSDLLSTQLIFLCLPTLFSEEKGCFDLSSIHEVCDFLDRAGYTGLVVVKSTLEPKTTSNLATKYSKLKLVHNPEFLSARTAREDFHNQTHVVLGRGPNVNMEEIESLREFYLCYYPQAKISICSSTESELMKLFCNSFYASKIQILNEYYILCQTIGEDYNQVKDLMLKNNWINPMHTDVPGPDGKLSYGGECFPKDTKALLHYMRANIDHWKVLESVVAERDSLRK